MSTLVGHKKTLSQVPDPLPHALLLTGPEGVGKRRAALELAVRTGVTGIDFQNVGPLTKESALAMREHHSTYPMGVVKVSVADLTHASSEARNSLLKLLEEPPEYSHLILHSDTVPFLTIQSRCFNLRFGSLSTEEVAEVLERLGVKDPQTAAEHSGGRVSVGWAYASSAASRADLRDVFNALVGRDGAALDRALAVAVEAKKGESVPNVEARRAQLCRLLGDVIVQSYTNEAHPLAFLPWSHRSAALKILQSAGRPALRLRAATWVMVTGDIRGDVL